MQFAMQIQGQNHAAVDHPAGGTTIDTRRATIHTGGTAIDAGGALGQHRQHAFRS
jgi:hypothetical protein